MMRSPSPGTYLDHLLIGCTPQSLYIVYIFHHPQPRANSDGFHTLVQSGLSDGRWWHEQGQAHFLRRQGRQGPHWPLRDAWAMSTILDCNGRSSYPFHHVGCIPPLVCDHSLEIIVVNIFCAGTYTYLQVNEKLEHIPHPKDSWPCIWSYIKLISMRRRGFCSRSNAVWSVNRQVVTFELTTYTHASWKAQHTEHRASKIAHGGWLVCADPSNHQSRCPWYRRMGTSSQSPRHVHGLSCWRYHMKTAPSKWMMISTEPQGQPRTAWRRVFSCCEAPLE